AGCSGGSAAGGLDTSPSRVDRAERPGTARIASPICEIGQHRFSSSPIVIGFASTEFIKPYGLFFAQSPAVHAQPPPFVARPHLGAYDLFVVEQRSIERIAS